MVNTLVSVDWLRDQLNEPNLMVLDASYHLPAARRDPDAEFVEQHIPGALRFDIDEISDPSVALPHTLPTPEQFDAAMQDLGIGAGMRVVVYDSDSDQCGPHVAAGHGTDADL